MHIATPTALWITPPTRAVWIPPGRTHEITMQGATAMRFLYIDPVTAGALPGEEAVFEVAPLLRELILHILGIGMLGPGDPAHERLTGLLIDLLVAAPRQDLALPLPRRPAREAPWPKRLQAEPGEDISLAGMARGAGVTTDPR